MKFKTQRMPQQQNRDHKRETHELHLRLIEITQPDIREYKDCTQNEQSLGFCGTVIKDLAFVSLETQQDKRVQG